MTLLAFDLSTRQGSIALCRDGELTTSRHWANDRRNSAPFFLALQEVVRAHGQPRRIVVGLGPGSYTGTRIAISAAIGLQMIGGAQLCGVPSVCALSDENEFAVIGDAKRNSFFFGRVRHGEIAGEIELLSSDEISQRLSKTLLPIYTSDALPQFPTTALRFPRAELLASCASRSENLARAPLEPIYLRPPHITQPRNQ
ncbi:MAG: tRNA (adenosine(37)-N6)-threonylcarbamoyltransferase complex dimerization subunit type 1 TsaB [Chthoniobacterales bacterium]